MSMRYPGGLIATSPVNAAYPSGVWTPSQSIPYQQQNVWTRDQYWPYTTLLLNGNGTNGAQNNTFLDSSTNNFTITRNGNTTQGSFTPYEANGYWSNYFDGTGDYLSVGSNAAFQFGTGDFTIECWFYDTGTSDDYPGLISSANGWSTGSTALRFNNLGNRKFGFFHNPTGDPIFSSSSTYASYQWLHVAVARSGSSLKMFVNGVQEASATVTASISLDNTTGVFIGSGFDVSSKIKGYISNVRVVKGTAVYTSAFTPSAAPLTAITNTSLLTCQSNRFIDNSTNAFAITRNGDTSVQAFQPFPGATTWSASVLGGSGYFDGTGDYLTTSTTQIIPTGSFTVECWAYVTGSGTNQKFVSQGSSGSAGRFSMGIEGGNWFTQLAGDLIQTGTPVRNQWNYVAVTYNGSTITMYVNGTSIGTVASSANAQNSALTIGQDWNTYTTTGYIADVRISNTVRTISVPTAPYTSDGNTRFLASFTNAGIFDSAMMNDLETVGNAQVSTSVVKYGTGSMLFDGSGDYLVRPDAEFLRLSSGDFTIEAWVYLTGNQPQFDGGVASYGATTTSAGWTVAITGSSAGGTLNRLVYGVNASASGGAPLYGVNGIALNTWTHIAVTKSGTTVRLFINGSLDNSGTVTATPTTSTSYFFYVGTQAYDPTATTRQFAGYIDDFRLTKGYARYITNFTPPPARLPPQ